MSRLPELRAVLPATLAGVEAFYHQFRQWFPETCEPKDTFASELLLREALGNCVAHAAGSEEPDYSDLESDDPAADTPTEYAGAPTIECVVRGGPQRLFIGVRDQGPGFDWREKGHLPRQEKATHGRGIAIYYRYAHRVRFNSRGNAVALVRHFAPGARSRNMITNALQEAIFRPEGDVVAASVAELRPKLRELVQAGARQLVVDLENTRMVDSVGLGLLIAAHNSLRKVGGELSIIHASPEILELLTTMRIHQHFSVRGKQ